MPIETLDLDGFLNFLREKQGDQTDKQFATTIGVSPQYLCDVYNYRRTPGESITSAMNAQRSVVFQVDIPEPEPPKKGKK